MIINSAVHKVLSCTYNFKIDFSPFLFFLHFVVLQNAPRVEIIIRMVSNFEQRFKNIQ